VAAADTISSGNLFLWSTILWLKRDIVSYAISSRDLFFSSDAVYLRVLFV